MSAVLYQPVKSNQIVIGVEIFMLPSRMREPNYKHKKRAPAIKRALQGKPIHYCLFASTAARKLFASLSVVVANSLYLPLHVSSEFAVTARASR